MIKYKYFLKKYFFLIILFICSCQKYDKSFEENITRLDNIMPAYIKHNNSLYKTGTKYVEINEKERKHLLNRLQGRVQAFIKKQKNSSKIKSLPNKMLIKQSLNTAKSMIIQAIQKHLVASTNQELENTIETYIECVDIFKILIQEYIKSGIYSNKVEYWLNFVNAIDDNLNKLKNTL